MFGFGEKARLKRLGDELKGASLREVIERFADSNSIERPAIKYSEDIAVIYENDLTDEDKQDPHLLWHKLAKITKEHNFAEKTWDIYFAGMYWSGLKGISIDFAMATIVWSEKETVVDYFFDNWLKRTEALNLLPVLFPPKCGRQIEDFRISRDIRSALIDELFTRLRSVDDFKKICSGYAKENPYFREYPL